MSPLDESVARARRPQSVYIAFEAFPRPKGASTHMGLVLRALARERAPVLLLCCGHGEMPALQVEGDIVIRRHKEYHPNMLARAESFAAFIVETLSKLEAPPSLCAFRDPWSGAPALSVLPDSACVFEVNALPSWELAYTYPAFASSHALRAKIEDMERFCLFHSDGVFTVSEITANAIKRMGIQHTDIAVVPNAAHEGFFSQGHGDAGEAISVEELRTGRWFGYFGSLHPWQGVDLLVDAWERVEADCPGLSLFIVHTNKRPELKRMRKRIRKRFPPGRVLLHPPIMRERLAPLIRRMEFTCAPLKETRRNTVQGCCPLKIVESMAAETPVLASDLKAVRDLVTHGEDAWLVPPDDVRAWALAIRRLACDEELRARLSRQAGQIARKRFTAESAIGTLNDVFDVAEDRAATRYGHSG